MRVRGRGGEAASTTNGETVVSAKGGWRAREPTSDGEKATKGVERQNRGQGQSNGGGRTASQGGAEDESSSKLL